MGPPPKFVVPRKLDGSMSFSSNSDQGSIDIKPSLSFQSSSRPPQHTLQVKSPEQRPPPDNNGKVTSKSSPFERTKKSSDSRILPGPSVITNSKSSHSKSEENISNNVATQPAKAQPTKAAKKKPFRNVSSGSAVVCTNSDEPSKKKSKVDLEAHGSSSKRDNVDIDKENKYPEKSADHSKKKAEKHSTKPCRSLTDEEYKCIFKAVLGTKNDVELEADTVCSISGAAEKKVPSSQDLFDMDDFEDEQDKGNHNMQLGESLHDNFEKKDSEFSGSDTGGQLKDEPMNSTLTLKQANSGDNSRDNTRDGFNQTTNIPPSPMISYLCHQSQPDLGTSLPQRDDNSQLEEPCSQTPSVGLSENVTTSTPLSSLTRPPYFSTRPSSTGEKSIPRPQGHSKSPATSQTLRTPISTPVRAPSVLQSSQQSGLENSCIKTPISATPNQPSQELITPVHTQNNKSVSQTFQNSPRGRNSVPSTPSCSQQTPSCSQLASQEIQCTPPPAGMTAKQRLIWLQEKRQAGLWVQCDEKMCGKWRYLTDCHDPSSLPEKWYCRMHPDDEFNHCDADEKRLSLHAEEDMIFNKYSAGSLVWAKVPGFPWWPAMVEDDPDLEQFYWLDLFSDIPTWYHVVFFDDEGRSSCSRSWVPVERLKKFSSRPAEEFGIETIGYKKRVEAAHKKACAVKLLNINDRLAQNSFAVCYKGPIGGPSKVKYEGPLGLRKQLTI